MQLKCNRQGGNQQERLIFYYKNPQRLYVGEEIIIININD